jgi:putative molybdopterin biosynthesis protein
MVQAKITHAWRLNGTGHRGSEAVPIALLAAIERRGSLLRAARELGISYRHAWGLVGTAATTFGAPLVALARGRGATLTPLGKQLLEIDAKAERRLAPHFARLAREVDAALRQHTAHAPATLALHASHDLTLEYLRDLAQSQHLRFELHFKGSLESLESFARGVCDIAGFHVPDRITPDQALRYGKWLTPESVQLIHLFERQQGLVVARGNPQRIRRLRDLARSGVRFVNRQQGSGTRLLFDSLLTAERVPPQRIRGYQSEEFTHGAVAAMVASGVADAAFAIEAVARQHGLDFIPLAREQYFLVVRDNLARERRFTTLLGILRGRKFKAHVAQLPGYDAARCGELITIAQALPF